ncbi:MAG: hypothetical protein J4G17_07535, partial [Anaerolineae bacterium]|nr:hypothetical protein [Anaerolineae bacterium]
SPAPRTGGDSWQRREAGFPPDVTDGSLPDWLQQGVPADPASDEMAWLEGDTPAAATTENGNTVLPWESGDISALPASPHEATSHEAGDELDWLNNPPDDGAPWFPENAPDESASSSHISHELLSTDRTPTSSPSGTDRDNPLRGLSPGPASGNPRQQQYVFSRLPLWLRVPVRGLPSLRPSRNPGQNLT